MRAQVGYFSAWSFTSNKNSWVSQQLLSHVRRKQENSSSDRSSGENLQKICGDYSSGSPDLGYILTGEFDDLGLAKKIANPKEFLEMLAILKSALRKKKCLFQSESWFTQRMT